MRRPLNALRGLVRRPALGLLHYTGALRILGDRQSISVPILMYHDILPEGYPKDSPIFGMTVSTPEFEWQINYLARHCTPLTLAQLGDWHQGKCELPRNSVLVTFDDGHRNIFTHALPILKSRSVPAVCFVLGSHFGRLELAWYEEAYYRIAHSPADCVQLSSGELLKLGTTAERRVACGRAFALFRSQRRADQITELQGIKLQLPAATEVPFFEERFSLLSVAELHQLRAAGVDIGAHSLSHAILSTLTPEESLAEIADSKLNIESALQHPVSAFAYPFGEPDADFTARECEFTRSAGYSLAFASMGGRAPQASHPFAIPRIAIGQDSRGEFVAKLTGAFDRMKSILRLRRT